MIKIAKVVDIYDAPRDTVVEAFIHVVETNGNPFYHRWRMNSVQSWDGPKTAEQKRMVDVWLAEQGLTEEDYIIITGSY